MVEQRCKVSFGPAARWDIEGVRLPIRATARTSLVLFALAFAAGAMVELLPSDATRWQRAIMPVDSVGFTKG